MSGATSKQSGTIPTGQTTLTILVATAQPPHSFQINGASAGTRTIAISLDGTNFVALTAAFTFTNGVVANYGFPIAAVQFTGLAGDTCKVL